jgi:hypothetical protein
MVIGSCAGFLLLVAILSTYCPDFAGFMVGLGDAAVDGAWVGAIASGD